MKIIEPSYEILTEISEDGLEELRAIERKAKICYQSKAPEDPGLEVVGVVRTQSFLDRDVVPVKTMCFIDDLIWRGHEAMLEHSQLSVKFICDRAVANELVRHREASFAQESTRYCNYSKDKFGGELTFIKPCFWSPLDTSDYEAPFFGFPYYNFEQVCAGAENTYLAMLKHGIPPEQARCILPLCLKTELVMTANYREWRHVFGLRCAKDAHPQMRQLMVPLLKELRIKLPCVFNKLRKANGDELTEADLE